jgi:hypothetical protein
MDLDSQLQILRIGHDTSVRGAGISLREAIGRARYEELRPNFGPTDLLPLIRKNSSLANEWAAYSEDKRTSGGWYLTNCEIGQATSDENLIFLSIEEAVANNVVRELDFWIGARRAA